jgi:hypothetical protein
MKKKPLGQPIGFLQGRPTSPSPYPPSSNMPSPSPFMSRPQGLPPGSGSTFQNQAPPSTSGPGGLLQGLLGGQGNFDLASTIDNARKVMGIINQAGPIIQQLGPIVKHLGPMLQLLQGSSTSQSSADKKLTTSSARTKERNPRRNQKQRGIRKRRNQRVRKKANPPPYPPYP